MFEKSASPRHKTQARVFVALVGQEPFAASVFLKVDERLIDLLNDARAFIPVRNDDGATIIIAKGQIASIFEIAEAENTRTPAPEAEPESSGQPEPQPAPRKKFDPFAVLRISPDASVEDIKRAYKLRMKSVHPDAIAGLDLDEDLERAALLAAQKVNHAYQMALRIRQQAERKAG